MTDPELVTLKEYILALIESGDKRLEMLANERDKQVALALAAAQTATDKAEAAALRVRDDQNEWRATTTDLIGRFATVEALDAVKEKQGSTDRLLARILGGLVVIAVLVPVSSALLSHFFQ